jgi:23S rRNA (pseudouridine1915-N3)-methyltransferase
LKLILAVVGRARDPALAAMFDDYVTRLARGGKRGWRVELREVEERRALPTAQAKARQSELLLARIPRGARLVALDANGAQLGSEAFAARLAAWRERGVGEIAFVIGGAEGLDAAILAKADLVLSLGTMTWPHMLVRVMLVEQLYRAQSILAGHPYHRR